MESRNASTSSFAVSPEDFIRGLYRGFLGREPDTDGLKFWVEAIASTGDSAAIINGILSSDECRAKIVEQDLRMQQQSRIAAQTRGEFEHRPLTIVDVGAQELEGEAHVYSAIALNELPYQIIGFEPLEKKINERRLLNPEEKIKLFPTFIGDGNTHQFHINSPSATSSLLPLNSELAKDLVGLSKIRTEKVESVGTKTLDDVLSGYSSIDFLKLDIQGFELPVLMNSRKVLERTNVIHCEVSFAEIYQDQSLFSEIEQMLRASGFYFLDFSSLCRYPYHCQSNEASRDRLGWGDAVFFKQINLLDKPQDILAQALIAYFIYGKYAIAEFLAERYDLLSGSRLRSVFGDLNFTA